MTNIFSMEEVIENSSAIASSPGATIVEETGDMNVNEETIRVAAHFRPRVQFRGFLGSSGPSHVTWVCLAYATGEKDTGIVVYQVRVFLFIRLAGE